MSSDRPRVLVVGGGIGGLSAAYLLHGPYAVTVCEAADEVGGNHKEAVVEGCVLNLGATYVGTEDCYSRWFLDRFHIDRRPILLTDARFYLDRRGPWNLAPLWLVFFWALLALLSVLAWFAPGLRELRLTRVLGWLPAGWRRGALLGIGYDPVTVDDLDGLLFFPYMRYIAWSFSATGHQVRWAQLSRDRLPAALREGGAEILTGTRVTALRRRPEGGFEATLQGPDGPPRAMRAALVICACYPEAAGEILAEVVDPGLQAALRGARTTPGYALVVPTPAAFRRRRLTFLHTRGPHGRVVQAMIDQQFGDGFSRAFWIANTSRADLLTELEATPDAVVAEHDTFVHAAPDHVSLYQALRPQLAALAADPEQDVFFCSYAYDPSGFRNADQSIMTAIRAARKICDRAGQRSEALEAILAVRPSLIGGIKRALLDNRL